MTYRVFRASGLDANTVAAMTAVFDEVCAELNLAPREDKLRDIIAHEIVDCMRKGQRDPAHIRTCTRAALHLPRS